MGFLEATRTCLSKFATFSGRASRSEYWWFLVAAVIATVILSIADSMIFGTAEDSGRPLTALFSLAIFLPLLAAAWRRLQDTGRPGWYALLPMVFSIAFVLLTLMGVMIATPVVDGTVAAGESATGLVALLGLTWLLLLGAAQIVVAVLMLWWLTRPSDKGANDYGPPPAS